MSFGDAEIDPPSSYETTRGHLADERECAASPLRPLLVRQDGLHGRLKGDLQLGEDLSLGRTVLCGLPEELLRVDDHEVGEAADADIHSRLDGMLRRSRNGASSGPLSGHISTSVLPNS